MSKENKCQICGDEGGEYCSPYITVRLRKKRLPFPDFTFEAVWNGCPKKCPWCHDLRLCGENAEEKQSAVDAEERKFMWFDGERQPNTLYIASVSRGKDSTAMLRAIQIMGWPLDAICSVDVWATQDIPAELPPMVKFKDEWDKKCLEHFGMPVTRLCATKRSRTVQVEREPESDGECHSRRLSYEDMFYRKLESGKFIGNIKGFPNTTAAWCRHLKMDEVDIRGYFLQTIQGEKGCGKWGGGTWDSRTSKPCCATANSSGASLRIPDFSRGGQLVYRPQTEGIYGFPYTGVGHGMGWCHQLKISVSQQREFHTATVSSKQQCWTGFPISPGTRGRK